MRKIRKSMFETNSSSTHALYICKDNKLEEPESLRFDLYAEFGWSFNTYNDQDSKFTYLGIAAIEASEEELEFYMVNLIEALNAIGYREIYDPKEEQYMYIDTEEEIKDVAKNIIKEYKEQNFSPYIDHVNEAYGILTHLINPANREELKNFMLNSNSFITTGNDNDTKDIWEDPNAKFHLGLKPHKNDWGDTEYNPDELSEDKYTVYYKGN